MSAIRRLSAIAAIAILSTAFLPGGFFANVEAAHRDYTDCSDGRDNDDDGEIDYPQDDGCRNLEDDSEGPSLRGLFVSLTDQRETVQPGGSLTYTVGLSTDRPDPKLVNVRFFIPHQTNLISASDGGRREGVYIVWDNVSVYPGIARRLSVNVEVTPVAEEDLLIIAEATSENEKASDTTRVKAAESPPFPISPTLSVTDGTLYAEPEEVLTYRIRATNVSGREQRFTLRTDLAPQLVFMEASAGFIRAGSDIEWRDEVLANGASKEYTLTAAIERETPDFTALRMRVSAGAAMASDTTTITTRPLPTQTAVTITDERTLAQPREIVTYKITIDNERDVLATDVDVNLALPSYAEFVDASEGGSWTGMAVRWQGLTVSPSGQRVLLAAARIRSDAPLGAQLRSTVDAEGMIAVDMTEVGIPPPQKKTARIAPPPPRPSEQILLSKVADRSEVQPGDRVTFTVSLRNTTDRTLTNIRIEDRMDQGFLQVLNAEEGRIQGDRIVWNVESLEPGALWTSKYMVRVTGRAPHGSELRNVVSVTADGLEEISLTERIYTSQLGVVTSLPSSGAPNDVIFLGTASLLGALSTFFQRRRILGF